SAGRAIAVSEAGRSAREAFAALAGSGRDWKLLVAKLGLGHGLLSPDREPQDAAEDERILLAFLELRSTTPGEAFHGGFGRALNRIRRPVARTSADARRWVYARLVVLLNRWPLRAFASPEAGTGEIDGTRIAYFQWSHPWDTETFVAREIQGLRGSGIDVE